MSLKTIKSSCFKWFLGTILLLNVFSFEGFARISSISNSIWQTTQIVKQPNKLQHTISINFAVSNVKLLKSKGFFTAVPFVNLIFFHSAQIQHFLFIQDLYKQVKIRSGFLSIRKTQSLNSEDSEILPLA